MVRIRYEKSDLAGVLRSAKSFRLEDGDTGSRLLWVWLDTVALTFRISEKLTDPAIGAGSAVSVPKLKLYAKKTLEHLGVTFDKEERDRGEDQDL